IFDFQPAAEIITLPCPRNLEVLDVPGIDLIQRRVPRVAAVATNPAPFAIRRSALLAGCASNPKQRGGGNHSRPQSKQFSRHIFSPSLDIHRYGLERYWTASAGLLRYSFDCVSLLSGVILS